LQNFALENVGFFVEKLMKERTSGNDVIKSSFDAQISDILCRIERKVEREEVEEWREEGRVALANLQERMVDKCDTLAGQQQQMASIFANVEESIKVGCSAICTFV